MSGIPPGLVEPELVALYGQFGAAAAEARELVAGLHNHNRAGAWRPGPGQWSIAECLDHLSTVGFALLGRVDRCIEVSRHRSQWGHGPFAYGRIESWLVRHLEPPPRFRLRTLRRYEPPPPRPLNAVLTDFLSLQGEFQRSVENAQNLDLVRARVRVLGPFTLSLGQALAGLTAHQRRHLRQAQAVRSAPGFPAPEGEAPAPAADDPRPAR